MREAGNQLCDRGDTRHHAEGTCQAGYCEHETEDPHGVIQYLDLYRALQCQNTEDKGKEPGIDLKITGQFVHPQETDDTQNGQQDAQRKAVAVDPLEIAGYEKRYDRHDAYHDQSSAQDPAQGKDLHVLVEKKQIPQSDSNSGEQDLCYNTTLIS